MFTVYYHKDFDGICTASLFSEIVSYVFSDKSSSFEFCGIDYNIKDCWLTTDLCHPCAVLDFPFHPDADWWFDHHTTSFLNYSLKKKFNSSPSKSWDPNFPSCPSLLKDHFLTYYPLYVNEDFFKKWDEWIRWSDIIDSAGYSSPKQLFELTDPCLKINCTLAIDESEAYRTHLIDLIKYNTPFQVTADEDVNERFLKYNEIQKNVLDAFKSILDPELDTVAFFDQTNLGIPFQRYTAYYFYPNLNYTVAVYRKDNGLFSVSVGKNPWKSFKSVNIGKICKRYGGGGRADVGAIYTHDYQDAIGIAKRISKKLEE